jgi:hypothetical protein
MAKVAFPFHVLHGGRLRAPHEALEVAETDIKKLVAIGAKVLEISPKQPQIASKQTITENQPAKRQYTKKKG